MKRTQFIELLANIRASIVPFIAILMFVALAVGIFVGISWSRPALVNAANDVFDEQSFHDVQIQFPYGLTEDDLDKLAALEGVDEVEAAWTSYQYVNLDGQNLVVKTHSIGKSIDVPCIIEGSLPTRAGEMAINDASAKQLNVGVGDKVTFVHDVSENDISRSSEDAATDEDGMTYLTSDTYRVTGIVETPDYLSKLKDTYGYSTLGTGTVDALCWLAPEAFDTQAFHDGYPVVNVRSNSLRNANTFANGYADQTAQLTSSIEDLSLDLADRRFESLRNEAQDQIDQGEERLQEAQQQIDDGQRQLQEAQQQVDDGERQLQEGRQKIDEAIPELTEAYDKITAGQAEYENGVSQLNDKIAELNEAKNTYNDAVSRIDTGKAATASLEATYNAELEYQSTCSQQMMKGEITKEEYDRCIEQSNARIDSACDESVASIKDTVPDVDYDLNVDHTNVGVFLPIANEALDSAYDTPIDYQGRTLTLNEARQEIADGDAQIADAQAKLDAAYAELERGVAEYNAGVQEVEDGKQEIEQKTAELEQAKQEIEQKTAELEDGKQELEKQTNRLDQAKDDLAAMKTYSWNIFPRSYNGGVIQVNTFANVVSRLRYSMAALFVIVGLLVCYSSVSRLVHEQVVQVGTKKALGLRNAEITDSFLAFSGIAVIAGVAIGVLLGVFLVEGIIGGAVGGKFTMDHYPAYWNWSLIIISGLIEMVLVLGATWIACRSVLRENAVELLRGEKPPVGKERFYEKWKLWKKLSLYTQIMVNNCFNDKRRVFNTVVGVAGCTALIVTAMTLNNDIQKSFNRQYKQVFDFDMLVYVEPGDDIAIAQVDTALDKAGLPHATANKSSFAAKTMQGENVSVVTFTPVDTHEFDQLYHVIPLKTDAPVDSDGLHGIWLSHAFETHLGTAVGDDMQINTADGTMVKVPIGGFYRYYLASYQAIMSPEAYRDAFGTDPSANVMLVNSAGVSKSEIDAMVKDIDGVIVVEDNRAFVRANFDSFADVSSAVVLIYLVLSILMALVVLLNLNVMFIEEKKRELIVLMINGFSTKEAKRYVSNDSAVLTAIGIVIGILFGCLMGAISVGAVEPSTAVFVKSPDLVAILTGTIGCAILAIVMEAIALRRIPRFDLTDINKL